MADRLIGIAFGFAAAVALTVVLWIAAFLTLETLPSLKSVGALRFLTDPAWQPTAGDEGLYGIGPMVAGSVLVTTGAMVLAVPVGIFAAIFSTFYAPAGIATFQRRAIEVLAGVPSVLFGLWGLLTIVPIINSIQPPGQSLLAAALVLALMVTPTVALSCEAALRNVPQGPLQAAAALGLRRSTTIRAVALPAARPGIIAGVLLATTRAIGETMAVLMVAGNVVGWPTSPFDPVRTVTTNIALEMGYATDAHRSALFASALALLTAIALTILCLELLRPEVADAS